jgi:hypothetical protein
MNFFCPREFKKIYINGKSGELKITAAVITTYYLG